MKRRTKRKRSPQKPGKPRSRRCRKTKCVRWVCVSSVARKVTWRISAPKVRRKKIQSTARRRILRPVGLRKSTPWVPLGWNKPVRRSVLEELELEKCRERKRERMTGSKENMSLIERREARQLDAGSEMSSVRGRQGSHIL